MITDPITGAQIPDPTPKQKKADPPTPIKVPKEDNHEITGGGFGSAEPSLVVDHTDPSKDIPAPAGGSSQ